MMGKEKEVAVKEVKSAEKDLKDALSQKQKLIKKIEKERLKIYELKEVTTKLQYMLVEATKGKELQKEETEQSLKVRK